MAARFSMQRPRKNNLFLAMGQFHSDQARRQDILAVLVKIHVRVTLLITYWGSLGKNTGITVIFSFLFYTE